MHLLSGEQMAFAAMDSGISDVAQRKRYLENFMAQETLVLKKGAQVMLIKNLDPQLVNGSLGKVVAFMDENYFNFYTSDEEAFMRAHKPEGESDEEENAKARRKFQAAVHKDGVTTGKRWPLVRFTLADNTCRTLLIVPEEWKSETPNGEVIAKRVQVPLILAWALSIHKAQGQTLERVKVDLGRVFEKGQAYVALSRATCQNGLQVTRFDQKKVMVHPKVIEFYNNLVSIGSVLDSNASAMNQLKSGAAEKGLAGEFADFEDPDEEELQYMYA